MVVAKLRASEWAYNFVGPKHTCAYCGDWGNTIDHCTPASFVEGNLEIIKKFRLFKVCSCLDCNVRAGDKIDENFAQRRKRIAISLRKNNRRILSTADWDSEEVATLGRSLRDYVSSGQQNAKLLLRRLVSLDNPVPPFGVPYDLMERIVITDTTPVRDSPIRSGF